MLNFRKLRQDFSSTVLKEGKELYNEDKVVSAKIIGLDVSSMRISAQIMGQYNNSYESTIEIDRLESEFIDSDCDCPYQFDCTHLAALLFYLEANLNAILVEYSTETDLDELSASEEFDEDQREELLDAVKEAAAKEEERRDAQYQKELMQEYIFASKVLSKSPFFLISKKEKLDTAELAIVYTTSESNKHPYLEMQLALRLPSRSKPLHIPNAREFLESLRHEESIYIGGRKYLFTLDSFKDMQREVARMFIDYARIPDKIHSEKGQRLALLEKKAFGIILAQAHANAMKQITERNLAYQDDDLPLLPCIYEGSLESPLKFSIHPAMFHIGIEYIDPPSSKILLDPKVEADKNVLMLEDVKLFPCVKSGMIHDHVYYRFQENITRQHLLHLERLRDVTIPEPLFGSFVENSLPQMSKFASLSNVNIIDKFVTLPFVESLEGICDLSYLDGELEASLKFKYNDIYINVAAKHLTHKNLVSFVKEEGVIARNLVEEQEIVDELFQDFYFDEETGHFVAKTEKKIIEFMTDVIPRYQNRIKFNCPQNLLDQFIYDKTKFTMQMSHTDRMDIYQLDLKVDGRLKGIRMDRLWECILSRRAYIELESTRVKRKKSEGPSKLPKILVLDLETITSVVQLFDELGIEKLDDHTLQRPLWSLANIDKSQFKGLPVSFNMTKKLTDIRAQMLGEKHFDFLPVPKEIKAKLRHYQLEGVQWLERLRRMYLSGVLADDMGLGKTLQAIVAMVQNYKKGNTALVVCPTSLLYNWKEELGKFYPKFKVAIIDGIPNQRKKIIDKLSSYDVVITSYSLLQKDVKEYESFTFSYMILDEAQHIKNRGTRNAKSVKQLHAKHRLILSGTPIENSLDELWSLFDFLMPGFLGSYDRFVEKYIRIGGKAHSKNLQYLRKKVSPFILRRMKTDVLDDLPPVSELVYHCQLTQEQQDLYSSYAASARDELTKLVERDGFDKVQIHVLATLTRLKQICCHPAIFAKESAEEGDCAKYEMLMELLQTLIEGNHKTVIFSQYTKMLQIMRNDFEQKGIRFAYLDGSSKNRLDIVKQFNEDKSISVFLVSLKAGGTGLNLVGADTVIHYDMWWNPAVENQATDRVHRLGQDKKVSVYKLITANTIEEKIVEMQKRKQGLVKKIVSCDEEAISKLTWEDVLELLQG